MVLCAVGVRGEINRRLRFGFAVQYMNLGKEVNCSWTR